jgi:hypothetical protein
MEVGQGKSARHERDRVSKPVGDSAQEALEQRIFDLSKTAGSTPILSLHAFQAIEHKQVPAAVPERVTKKMQEPCPFRRN